MSQSILTPVFAAMLAFVGIADQTDGRILEVFEKRAAAYRPYPVLLLSADGGVQFIGFTVEQPTILRIASSAAAIANGQPLDLPASTTFLPMPGMPGRYLASWKAGGSTHVRLMTLNDHLSLSAPIVLNDAVEVLPRPGGSFAALALDGMSIMMNAGRIDGERLILNPSPHLVRSAFRIGRYGGDILDHASGQRAMSFIDLSNKTQADPVLVFASGEVRRLENAGRLLGAEGDHLFFARNQPCSSTKPGRVASCSPSIWRVNTPQRSGPIDPAAATLLMASIPYATFASDNVYVTNPDVAILGRYLAIRLASGPRQAILYVPKERGVESPPGYDRR